MKPCPNGLTLILISYQSYLINLKKSLNFRHFIGKAIKNSLNDNYKILQKGCEEVKNRMGLLLEPKLTTWNTKSPILAFYLVPLGAVK